MLHIESRAVGHDVALLSVQGKVTYEVTGELRDAIRALVLPESAPKILVIGMEGVSYIDSSGLGLLVATKNSLTKHSNGILRLAGVAPQVRKVFEQTNLISYFHLFLTEEEALAAPYPS